MMHYDVCHDDWRVCASASASSLLVIPSASRHIKCFVALASAGAWMRASRNAAGWLHVRAACSYLIMAVLIPAPDSHLGSKMIGGCVIMGTTLVGAVLAGVLVSVAKALPLSPYSAGTSGAAYHGFTALYVLLAELGLALLAINRSVIFVLDV